MASSLSTTLHSFFGGSGSAKQGDSLGGLLRKVLPIRGLTRKVGINRHAAMARHAALRPKVTA